MSYILEALKKAEQQREIGQVPRIDSEHEPAVTGSSSRWVVIVVLVLSINAALLLVLFWPEGSTDVAQPVAVAPEPQRTGSSGVVSGPVAETDALPLHEDNAANRSIPASSPIPPQRMIQAVPAPHVTPEPASRAAEAPPKVPPVVAPVPVQPRPAPVTAPAPEQVPHMGDLPVWPQVPTHIFQHLRGGLRLDVHVYSDQPADRFVLINLQKYREGEQLQEGPVLDEITPEGVVLSFQGRRFLVRAQ